MPAEERERQSTPCLCVDLDGTLIKTNSLFEVSWALVRADVFSLCKLPFWLLKGQAYLWRQLASRSDIDPSLWPRRLEVEGFVRQEQKLREVFLVTGSHISVAARFASAFEGFAGVYGTEDNQLTGERKAAFLKDRFGEGNFDYLGDSVADLAVWRVARTGYLAIANSAVQTAVAKESRELIVLPGAKPSSLKWFVKGLRVHQWSKSLLVLLPAVMAHQVGDAIILLQSLTAFACFCAISSSMYLLNDCLDIEADRGHSVKSRRAVASGDLPLPVALGGSVLLAIFSLLLAAYLSLSLAGVVLVYLVVVMLYSAWLKKLLVVDLILLALFYILRILGGSVATGIPMSFWLSLFSLFLFFGLAVLKRCSELNRTKQAGKANPNRRSYQIEDLMPLTILGSSAHIAAVLVVGLYIHSEEVVKLYESPAALWLFCPLILSWCARLWILCGRGEVEEDPIAFALSDRWSYGVASIGLLVILVATIK